MTPEEQINKFRIDKQLAMINVCIHAADAISKSCKKIPRKKAFGTKGRTPNRRSIRKLPLLEMTMQAYMSSFEIAMINQMPLPQYESGTHSNGGILFGKHESEYFVMPNEKDYKSHPVIEIQGQVKFN